MELVYTTDLKSVARNEHEGSSPSSPTKFIGDKMAQETKCLTSGARFHIGVHPRTIDTLVELPFELDLTEEEAETLTRLIHNQLELVLRPYWRLK